MMFHDIPRCSTTFHDVPRHSTMFHDIPRCSTTFHDVQQLPRHAILNDIQPLTHIFVDNIFCEFSDVYLVARLSTRWWFN
ncbi:uncharacterized protein YALI1_A13131g [Yarrowia lipolytica]|uniref:Uncharacterized protein n=1 Tax=Yarrowia lipolytica TaxID=4952 RepID=A0A1D8N4M7_YARLL|nr:hypothetical protein YALI1_A13131g [Yarrowia lipolytica]